MHKQILYIDMDEVLVDFYNHPNPEFNLQHWDREARNPASMYMEGFFEGLPPLEGAVEAVRRILKDLRFDVYILTQPVAGNPASYMGKAEWIQKHLPELTDKLIMTQNKLLNLGDILIDDSPKWEGFQGDFIHFLHKEDSKAEWRSVLDYLGVA